MKTHSFTLTPRLDRFATVLALFALIILASCVPAFAQADSASVDHERINPAQAKEEAHRVYVNRHAVTNSDTIGVFVTRIIDGDTFICVTCLDCSDSISVRVLGLDTFEKRKGEHFDRQARLWNYTEKQVKAKAQQGTEAARKLLLRKQVTLHKGNGSEDNLDQHHRPLRFVRLPNGQDYSALMRSRGLDSRK